MCEIYIYIYVCVYFCSDVCISEQQPVTFTETEMAKSCTMMQKKQNYLIGVYVGHQQGNNNNENKNPLEEDTRINVRFDIDNYIY